MISFKVRTLSDFFTARKILFLLWLFLLVFPKGGIKMAGIPLTWGYALLGLVSAALILRGRFRINTPRLQALVFLLPFQIISSFSLAINGVESFGFGVSIFISFMFFPLAFFFLFSEPIEKMDLQRLYELTKYGIFLVSIYGIFLFFYKLTTGNLIEIPFLTINYHDMGEIALKHNDRGLVFKLISTYNNGNIYGICILIFLAFYCYLENSRWRKYLVKFSLVLTFSRTVWLGLIFNEIIYDLLVSKKGKLIIFKMIFGLGILISVCIGVAAFIGLDSAFFLDRSLGGRLEQLDSLESSTFLPHKPFRGISEIVYLSILDQFGILGFISFLLALCAPLFLAFFHWKDLNPVRSSLLCGLLTYLFISASDGALLYIPVMAFYWFHSALALRKTLALA